MKTETLKNVLMVSLVGVVIIQYLQIKKLKTASKSIFDVMSNGELKYQPKK